MFYSGYDLSHKVLVIVWESTDVQLFRDANFVVAHVSGGHQGRVTHICVGKLSIIGSDNGLSPGRRQTII